ncbi:polyketide synthase [Mycobacterium sp. 852014-52144_SCH5372336]|nr:polyketide synthase [Mycobacterium sp. 852014-52144_SCH5372336]
MACRLPDGIDSPARLWESLLRGDDLVTEIPGDRWDADDFYDPEPEVPGQSVSKWGAFLDDVAGFDSGFFGIADAEAAAMDPQHRLLLENCWEATEHAGLVPQTLSASLTGVFVGLDHSDYQLVNSDSDAMAGPFGYLGNSSGMASGRIARILGLRGPAVTLDAAGSSGLLAVHMACRSLGDAETDLAFAGGAFVMLEPRRFLEGTARGELSPTGRCRAFDATADGCVYGEGSAVVLLKRLPDAIRDGDRILAVVRGTAANQQGRIVETSESSLSALTSLYRAALTTAGVDAKTIGLVEAHGAGSPVDDPIEYTSVTKIYGVDSDCALGSVKTNLGHAQSASGTVGLMKAVLALRHGVIPPSLHFTRLPEELADVHTKLSVSQDVRQWPSPGEHPRRAAVSSCGVTGTNVHAILEQAPPPPGPEAGHDGKADATLPAAQPFLISSSSTDQLRRTASRLADWVQAHDDEPLSDLAYTLARRRAHRPMRTAVIASSRPDLVEGLRAVAADDDTAYRAAVGHDDRGPVWVFSGEATQWAAVGAHLLRTEPVFAATVAQIDSVIARECSFSVTEMVSSPNAVTGIERAQPTLFTMQVALATALDAYGLQPGAVIGHSLGEAAAAVVAGALSLEDGVRVVCRRSRLLSRIADTGAMASVELPAKQVLSELTMRRAKDVAVAIAASPESTVISGAANTVRDLVAGWQQRDVVARELPADVAVHSPQVDSILGELTDALAELNPATPKVPFYSATQFDPREQPVCDSRYWVDNLRRTGRFGAAVRAALEDGYKVFAELVPEALLTKALEQTAHSLDMELVALAVVRNEEPLSSGLRGVVAEVHRAGAAVDFSVLYPNGNLVDAPLPSWTHRQLWLGDNGHASPTHSDCTVAVHPLLGQHVRLPEEPERHVWQREIDTTQTWLDEYQIGDKPALPGAALCEMALTAAHAVFGETTEVRDIRLQQTLHLDGPTVIDASATVGSPGSADFTVETNRSNERVRHAAAILGAANDDQPPAYEIQSLLSMHPQRENGAALRERLEQSGVRHGPAFTGLDTIHTDRASNTVLAELALPRQIRSGLDDYDVHPALLDACFQSAAAHPDVQALDGEAAPGLPVSIRRLRPYGSARGARFCYTKVIKADSTEVEADLEILDDEGTVLLVVEGLRLSTGTSEHDRRDRVFRERLLTVEWLRRQLPEPARTSSGKWLLISATAADLVAAALAGALSDLGAQCTPMDWPQHADVIDSAATVGNHLRAGGFTGVVVLAGPKQATEDGSLPLLGHENVQRLVHLARALSEVPTGSPQLYVVTRNAQPVVAGEDPNLEQAGLRGLVRAIGAEHPHLHTTLIDLDDSTDARHVAQQLVGESEEDETAWRNSEWYVARLQPSPLRPDERRTTVADHQHDGICLQIRTPDDLETLELVACERNSPGPGQIEVAVRAAGINSVDVLVAMGRLPSMDGHRPQLGMEFVGVVTALGPGVVDHHVGDHVGGVADGCWRSFLTCDARLAVRLPEGLSDGQAAAATVAYATAWYGLHDLAGIGSGDKVLIQSAAGGVGQAAIAIARAVGAEIFATAGSPQHRQILRDMGVQHVYDSGSIEFAESIRRDTNDYGVDIVLNSLAGAARRAGLELLSVGGRFIEIGTGDIHGDTRLWLAPFRHNLTFHAFDLALLSRTRPQRVRDLLQKVYALVAQGDLPAAETTHYSIEDAASALRLMGAADHFGKLVLDVPDDRRDTVIVPPEQVPVFRRDGAYVIAGALGDFGLHLAEKMAAAGCGRVVISARSRPTFDAERSVERLRASGADVEVVTGDIADANTVQRLVATATAAGHQVRGVLHLTASTDEATLSNLTDALIEGDWAATVHGAWNLHTATSDQPLDWFCSFSSVAALMGAPGQGGYAAATGWVDAFMLWRRAHGLRATAIAWGAIGRSSAASSGADAIITPEEAAYALDTLLRHDRGYTGYAPLEGTPWLAAFSQRSPFAEAFRSTSENAAGSSQLRSELNELPRNEWPGRLRRLISDQISLILRRSIDPDRPLAEYGVDSLGALELRTRIEAETGVRLTAGDIATINIRDLAVLLCERLAAVEGG